MLSATAVDQMSADVSVEQDTQVTDHAHLDPSIQDSLGLVNVAVVDYSFADSSPVSSNGFYLDEFQSFRT